MTGLVKRPPEETVRRTGPVLYHYQVRVLVAVLRVAATVPRVTYDALEAALGLNRSTIREHLCALRRAGFVDWEPGRSATLHALVRPVAFGEAA